MSKELTLSELLTQRCVEFANSEQAVEIIDKGITKLFTSVVDDAFRSYSDFGKAFKEAMENALPTSIEDMVDLKNITRWLLKNAQLLGELRNRNRHARKGCRFSKRFC